MPENKTIEKVIAERSGEQPIEDKAPEASNNTVIEAPEEIRVRATKLGWYDLKRRRVGDIFTLRPVEVSVRQFDERTKISRVMRNEDGSPQMRTVSAEQQFSFNWMERVSNEYAETRPIGAQEALKHTTDELKSWRQPQKA
jgi:hypothetical protein